LNVAVVDSVAVTLWRTLELAGGDAGALADWGRIFQTSTVIK
jgi:maleate isomerase